MPTFSMKLTTKPFKMNLAVVYFLLKYAMSESKINFLKLSSPVFYPHVFICKFSVYSYFSFFYIFLLVNPFGYYPVKNWTYFQSEYVF